MKENRKEFEKRISYEFSFVLDYFLIPQPVITIAITGTDALHIWGNESKLCRRQMVSPTDVKGIGTDKRSHLGL